MDFAQIDRILRDMEELQAEKVIALARRLKPGLTLEDIKNPHDFPELDDHDWHYADGILTGIQSVASALRAAMLREGDRDEAEAAEGERSDASAARGAR